MVSLCMYVCVTILASSQTVSFTVIFNYTRKKKINYEYDNVSWTLTEGNPVQIDFASILWNENGFS